MLCLFEEFIFSNFCFKLKGFLYIPQWFLIISPMLAISYFWKIMNDYTDDCFVSFVLATNDMIWIIHFKFHNGQLIPVDDFYHDLMESIVKSLEEIVVIVKHFMVLMA